MANLTLILAMTLVSAAQAGGGPQDLVLEERKIEVGLHENLAFVKATFKVRNPTDRALEGEILFSAPPGAAVYEATLLKHLASTQRRSKGFRRDEAAMLYAAVKEGTDRLAETREVQQILQRYGSNNEFIIRRLGAADRPSSANQPGYTPIKDPALVEQMSDETYRIRFFPVPARDDQTATLRVAFEVPRDGDACLARVPLKFDTNFRPGLRTPPDLRISLVSSRSLGAIASSSHRFLSERHDRDAHRFSAVVEHDPDQTELALSYALDPRARLHDFIGAPVRQVAEEVSAYERKVPAEERALQSVRARRALERAPESERSAMAAEANLVSPGSSLLVIEEWFAKDVAREQRRLLRGDPKAAAPCPASPEEARQCDLVRRAAGLPSFGRPHPCEARGVTTSDPVRKRWAEENGVELTGSRGTGLPTSVSFEYARHAAGCPVREPNVNKLEVLAGKVK